MIADTAQRRAPRREPVNVAGRATSFAGMDAAALRAEFPALARVAYLNAGTAGPWPSAATRSTMQVLETAEREGRSGAYFATGAQLAARLRAAYASLLGADVEEVALTASTSDGIARVLAGLELRAGDEVLTSIGEHPGLLGPLGAAVAQRGVAVREVPLARIAEEAGPRTRLVACSHVHWATGEVAPEALTSVGVPVLLDGAQGAGAVRVRVGELGCAFYAASGQKWLCGPVGTGMLWIDPAWSERVVPRGPTFLNLADPSAGLANALQPDARRHDAPGAGVERCAGALAAHDVLAAAGWDAVHERAASLAHQLAAELAAAGHDVLPRGDTTLVTWRADDPATARARLVDAGIVVRDIPGRPWLRASVGAWNDESDLERLLAALRS
jgi:L-cysteine/cystine lyase